MSRLIKTLLISRTFFSFAGAMYPVVLPLFILKITGSLASSGLFLTLVMLPSMLIMPFVGVWIEGKQKKAVTIGSLTILFILTIAQSFYLLVGRTSLVILGLASAVICTLFSVIELATKIMFSEIVPEGKLEKYNGLKSVWDNISSFGAPVIGTMVYGFSGFEYVALIVSIFFLISAIILSKMSRYAEIREDATPAKMEFFKNLKEGIQFVRENKGVRNFYFLASGLNFFVANQEEVINPGILIQKYNITAKIFGFVSFSFTLGVILAGLFLAKRKEGNSRQILKQLFITNSSIMIVIGTLSVIMHGQHKLTFFYIFLFLEFCLGFITILINVPMTSYFQSTVPIGYQGRVFGLLGLISSLSVPIGISYTGFLAQIIGADFAYIVNNLCVVLIVLIVLKDRTQANPK
ncbi:MFS transporter [Lacticaseibacillus rhamnosus]|uniref:MFS transporter n=1 Tax=Lacticaseibacillus rhamnosus TaxID=47715 RepID=UPI0021A53E14|nr:MFS transporter [Lacticaseibacillus rhamnosus]MCT3174230.1 MFS transporter [Lacticaseibacillus rhamnosus]MCT3179973.1 MFS transporter [Lacticaseibacillus rhamnosus]